MAMKDIKIISCNSNKEIALGISQFLEVPIAQTEIKHFSDREVLVDIQENVRGKDVFVIQSTSTPANDNLMELLITIDALRRASAKRVTAVIPYFGYARQDRKSSPRAPITAKLVANLITSAGAERVLTLDLHANQIQGFFDIPVDNLYASPVFSKYIAENYQTENLTIISPDVGGLVRARDVAKRINAELAIVDKRRPKAGVSEVMNIIGDVQGKNCVIIDDIVDSGGTLCNAASAILDKGAASVSACITHGVLSGEACKKVANSDLSSLVITNSIMPSEEARSVKNIKILDISDLLGQAVKNIDEEKSLSVLFN